MKKRVQRIITPFASIIIYTVMMLLWHTSRKRFHYAEPISDGQHIIACWHSDLLMIPIYRHIRPKQKAKAIISLHSDGEIVARVLRYLKIESFRGSSRKGGKKVLLEAFNALKDGYDIQITPDGPKGPRYHVHNGVIALAFRENLPIMTIGYRASRYWQLKSWDKFVIPKPFGVIDFYIDRLQVENLSLEEAKKLLKTKMMLHALP